MNIKHLSDFLPVKLVEFSWQIMLSVLNKWPFPVLSTEITSILQVLQFTNSSVELDATPNAEFSSWHKSARLIFNIHYVG
jgi:hypothetical protein